MRYFKQAHLHLNLLPDLLHLLLNLLHLLAVEIRLLSGIAQFDADIAGDRTQAEYLAASIERPLRTNRVIAVRSLVADLERKRGVDDDAMVRTELHAGVNRNRKLPGKIYDDIAVVRLKLAWSERFSRPGKPSRNSTCAGGGADRAIHLRKINAPAGRLQIGRAGCAHEPNSSAARRRAHQAGGIADFDLSARGLGVETGTGVFERHIATTGIEMRHSANRGNPNMTTRRMENGIARDGSSGDMAAASGGGEIASDVSDTDVTAAFGGKPRRTRHVPYRDIASGGGEDRRGTQVTSLNIASAGRNVEGEVSGHTQVNRDPKPALALAPLRRTMKIDAACDAVRNDPESLKQRCGISLRHVGFEMNAIIDLASVLCVDDDVTEVGDEPQARAVTGRDGAAQLGSCTKIRSKRRWRSNVA